MNLYNRFLFCNMFLPLGRYLHGGYYWNRKNFHVSFLTSSHKKHLFYN